MGAIERWPTPHMNRCLGAETEPALVLVRLDAQREQQPVPRRRQIHTLDRGAERAALVVGESPSLELRLEQPIDFGERNIDRHRDIDSALLDLRDELQLRRERTI